MAQVEEQFIAEGAQIIWVLTESGTFAPGTAENCQSFMQEPARASGQGFCVGDSQTMGQLVPSTTTFADSDFADGRGYDVIVTRSDMRIRFVSSHGTPAGNDNLTGAELLEEVRTVMAGL